MDKKLIKVVCLSLLSVFIVTISGWLIVKSMKQSEEDSIIPSLNNSTFEGFAYISGDDTLKLVSTGGSSGVQDIAKNVIDLKSSKNFIVYHGKNGYSKALYAYDMRTGETKNLRKHYINDFVMLDDSLFLIENKKITQIDLNTLKEESLMNVSTNDIFFMSTDPEKIIYSLLENGVSTIYSYDVNSAVAEKIGENITDVRYANGEYFGINENMDFFRINDDGVLESIDGMPMVDYHNEANHFLFIDSSFNLNVLDKKKGHREIASSISKFKVIDDIVYYMSGNSNNPSIYTLPISGRHKRVLVEDARTDMKLEVFINS